MRLSSGVSIVTDFSHEEMKAVPVFSDVHTVNNFSNTQMTEQVPTSILSEDSKHLKQSIINTAQKAAFQDFAQKLFNTMDDVGQEPLQTASSVCLSLCAIAEEKVKGPKQGKLRAALVNDAILAFLKSKGVKIDGQTVQLITQLTQSIFETNEQQLAKIYKNIFAHGSMFKECC